MAFTGRPEAVRDPDESAGARRSETCSVLVADDDIDLCTSLGDVLELKGHAVDIVHSGQATIDACARQAHDVLLLDIRLPDISGLDLISQLEEIRPELEILVITGNASLDSAVEAVSRSTIGYLIKPVDLERLLSILGRVGERKRLGRENLRLLQEREALIQQLESKNNELERYTYTVSHDLKSPLITISGFLSHVESSARGGKWDRFEADLGRIDNAVRKMRDLLDQLLELSRIGRVANPTENVPISELAHEVAELVAGQAKEKSVEIVIAEGLPTVRGDRVRLREVFQNLIDNAVKFMGDQQSPRVEVGARSQDGETVFFVADNGVGIEPEQQEKVFGLFDQTDLTAAGTGIGLALVRRIVDIHGGRIWIESAGQGEGTAFRFTLGSSTSSTRSA